MNMELKDFIKGTISDIAMAIKELNDEVSDTMSKTKPEIPLSLGMGGSLKT